MLNNPARKPSATARLPKIYGVLATRLSRNGLNARRISRLSPPWRAAIIGAGYQIHILICAVSPIRTSTIAAPIAPSGDCAQAAYTLSEVAAINIAPSTKPLKTASAGIARVCPSLRQGDNLADGLLLSSSNRISPVPFFLGACFSLKEGPRC